jgi:hypothetical protein
MFAHAADANKIALLRNRRILDHFIETAVTIMKKPRFSSKFGMDFNLAGRAGDDVRVSGAICEFNANRTGDDEFAVSNDARAGFGGIAAARAINNTSCETARHQRRKAEPNSYSALNHGF